MEEFDDYGNLLFFQFFGGGSDSLAVHFHTLYPETAGTDKASFSVRPLSDSVFRINI